MKKSKVLSYQELMALAKKNYNRGGDSIFECWDENTFSEYVRLFGDITESKAKQMFKLSYSIDRDRAGYC